MALVVVTELLERALVAEGGTGEREEVEAESERERVVEQRQERDMKRWKDVG